MPTLIASIIIVLITITVLGFLGLAFGTQIVKGDILHYLSATFTGCGKEGKECCPQDWCDVGLICYSNMCSNNTSIDVKIDESFLIFNPETASKNVREEYLYSKTGIGWEDCKNGISNCLNCSKLSNFTSASECTDCSGCYASTGKCNNCLSCSKADDTGDGQTDTTELHECFSCTECGVNSQEYSADSCSKCSYCNVANNTYYENGLNCENCYQCNLTESKCYSCYNCGSIKKVCDECNSNPSTTCNKKHDYLLCDEVKKCIVDYEGQPCNIFSYDFIPVPWNNGYFFNTTVTNVLKNCISEELYETLPNGGEQKICNYDNQINFLQSDITFIEPGNFLRPYFTSDGSLPAYSNLADMLTSNLNFGGVTGENKGILFNGCGINNIKSSAQIPPRSAVIYNSDSEIFSSSTTPKKDGDIAVNLKMVVNDVLWNENSGNNCSFNIYLCPQQAVAENIDDPILNFYRFFTYFNDTEYSFTKTDWKLTAGGYKVNVTGIRYSKLFNINLSDRKPVNVQHIAKVIIAGLRDYMFLNSDNNQTVKFFCLSNGLYSSEDDCYKNNVSIVLNDNAPWNLNPTIPADSLSSIPDYKYIYYDPSISSYSSGVNLEVTFFAYSSNIPRIENKIFISPLIILKTKCSDGTSFGQCSSTKPKYCDSNGVLHNFYCYGPDLKVGTADDCGCPSGSCQPDGSCPTGSCSRIPHFLRECENPGDPDPDPDCEAKYDVPGLHCLDVCICETPATQQTIPIDKDSFTEDSALFKNAATGSGDNCWITTPQNAQTNCFNVFDDFHWCGLNATAYGVLPVKGFRLLATQVYIHDLELDIPCANVRNGVKISEYPILNFKVYGMIPSSSNIEIWTYLDRNDNWGNKNRDSYDVRCGPLTLSANVWQQYSLDLRGCNYYNGASSSNTFNDTIISWGPNSQTNVYIDNFYFSKT